MSKYGSGVSMRTVIESEVREAEQILKESGLSEDGKEQIIDMLKEMAYQWCAANASACSFEGAVKEKYPDEFKILLSESIRSGIKEQKIAETYPF